MNTEPVNTGAVERQPSRKIAWTCGLVLTCAAAQIARAQTPDDSLRVRLRRAEDAIAVLQRQMAEQAESGVQTRSRARLEFSGRVVVNGFGNSRRVNNVDNPQFVRPDTSPSVPVRGVGMAIRQTRLGLAVTVADVLGGSFAGDVDVDFYGGQQPSSGGRTFPLVRLRRAVGIVSWPRAQLLFGQESPLVAERSPRSLASVGTPDFATAGNLWLWLPQFRATLEQGYTLRLAEQVAVLAPTSGTAQGLFNTQPDSAERSGRPYLQARV